MDQTSKGPSYVSDGVYYGIREYGSSDPFTDVGVMENGFTSTLQSAATSKEFGNRENASPVAKNQKIQIAPTQIYTIENETIALLSGGLITEETIAGTSTTDDQVIASGWSYLKPVLLDGQNDSGLVPTINSVDGGTDGALLTSDYELVQVSGGWAIYFISGGSITTIDQSMTVNSTYTPTASSILYSGESSTEITPIEVRMRHYTNAALTEYDYSLDVFRAFVDPGSLVFTKNGARSDTDYDSFTVTMTGETDSSRVSGKQLYSEERK